MSIIPKNIQLYEYMNINFIHFIIFGMHNCLWFISIFFQKNFIKKEESFPGYKAVTLHFLMVVTDISRGKQRFSIQLARV